MAKREKVELTDEEIMAMESTEEQATPAVVGGASFMPRGFKRGKAIVLPVFSFKNRNTAYLKFVEPIKVGEPLPGDDGSKPPAHIAEVIDLETGEPCLLIVPKVLESVLTRQGDYVGKSFELQASIKKGKKFAYKDFLVWPLVEG
jgi:hypothetical protein